MPDNATGSGDQNVRPGSVLDSISAFERLLDRDPSLGDPDKSTIKATPPAQKATGDAGADEQPPEDDENLSVDADEETKSEDEEQKSEEEDDQPTESLYTVTIDGKEEKVSASELVAGYQRQQSYTRKSMALADERKSFAKTMEETQAERAEYAALIPQLKKALSVQQPDWDKVKAEHPEQYPALWADWQQHLEKIRAVSAEESRVNAAMQADFERARETLVNNERNAFLQVEPSWRDPKVASRDAKDVQSVLTSLGFTGDDLQIYDHRSLRLALMAAKYMRSTQAKNGLVKQRADGAPVVASGSGPAKKVIAGKAEAAKFYKTGNLKDAAKMFEVSGLLDRL